MYDAVLVKWWKREKKQSRSGPGGRECHTEWKTGRREAECSRMIFQNFVAVVAVLAKKDIFFICSHLGCSDCEKERTAQ